MSKLTQEDLHDLTDELGFIRAQMADLKDREKDIRESFIKAGVKAMEGETFRTVVVESLRTMIDWKLVAAKLKPSRQLVRAHTTEKEGLAFQRLALQNGCVPNSILLRNTRGIDSKRREQILSDLHEMGKIGSAEKYNQVVYFAHKPK